MIVREAFEPLTPEQWARLRANYPDTLRIFVAIQLARDVDACAALLRGEPVDPSRLDRAQLEKARVKCLVQFVAPIELIFEAAA